MWCTYILTHSHTCTACCNKSLTSDACLVSGSHRVSTCGTNTLLPWVLAHCMRCACSVTELLYNTSILRVGLTTVAYGGPGESKSQYLRPCYFVLPASFRFQHPESLCKQPPQVKRGSSCANGLLLKAMERA